MTAYVLSQNNVGYAKIRTYDSKKYVQRVRIELMLQLTACYIIA